MLDICKKNAEAIISVWSKGQSIDFIFLQKWLHIRNKLKINTSFGTHALEQLRTRRLVADWLGLIIAWLSWNFLRIHVFLSFNKTSIARVVKMNY